MKKLQKISITALGTTILLVIFYSGCTRSISVPVSPEFVNTPTPTATATTTSTPTNQGGFTSTSTPTATDTNQGGFTSTPTTPVPTNTYTYTNTATQTWTPTTPGVPTNTFTFTFTNTNTFTSTATNTVPTSTPTTPGAPTNTFTSTCTNTATSTISGPTSTPTTPIGNFMVLANATYAPGCTASYWGATTPTSGSSPGGYGSDSQCLAVTFAAGSITGSGGNAGYSISPPAGANASSYNALSFYIKASTALPMGVSGCQPISGSVTDTNSVPINLTTSWQACTIYVSSPRTDGYTGANNLNNIVNYFTLPTGSVAQASQVIIYLDQVQLIQNAATQTPVPTLGPLYITDFDFNGGGTSVNPQLTNFVSGCGGVMGIIPTGGTVNGILASPLVVSGDGYNSTYAAEINATWTDAADSTYPSVQLQVSLSNGSNYYIIPSGVQGIDFYLNVKSLTVDSGTAPSLALAVVLASTVPSAGGMNGQCGSKCYDNFAVSLPSSTSGYVHEQILLSAFARGGWGSTIAYPTSCSPSNTALNDGCNTQDVMQLSWAAASGNNAGNYTAVFDVDNITFY